MWSQVIKNGNQRGPWGNKKTPKLVSCIQLVTSTEFESVNAAVKGQCVKPLHQLAK